MRINYLLFLLVCLIPMFLVGQDNQIRIGPGPLPNRPEPVVICDGIRLPSSVVRNFFDENKAVIDSVALLRDSVFNCEGELINFGIAKIHTKDSVNPGAKKILALTNGWLYKHPLTELMINNSVVDWNEKTYRKLTGINPENIISAKIKKKKQNDCIPVLQLRIKE